MQVIPTRMTTQVESPDEYIDRVQRHVAEQIRQQNIARKKFWMDGLKSIIVMLLLFAFAVLVLAGLAAAEPQPVDGGWHRSDGVPAETPTAAPPDDEPEPIEPEAAEQRFDVGLSPWNTLSEDEQMWVVVTAVVAGLFLIGVLYLFTMIGRVAKEGNCEWKPKR